jgi:Protein of unknown function (DUF2752)
MDRAVDTPARNRAESVWPYAVAAAVASALVMLFVWNPATTKIFPPCPFHALTGYHCPGCGSLRATHRLLHGEVWSAFRMNPLMVLSLPLLGYAFLSSKWRGLRLAWIDRFTRRSLWPLMILVVLVLYWVLRNLPFIPFSLLAPYHVPGP